MSPVGGHYPESTSTFNLLCWYLTLCNWEQAGQGKWGGAGCSCARSWLLFFCTQSSVGIFYTQSNFGRNSCGDFLQPNPCNCVQLTATYGRVKVGGAGYKHNQSRMRKGRFFKWRYEKCSGINEEMYAYIIQWYIHVGLIVKFITQLDDPSVIFKSTSIAAASLYAVALTSGRICWSSNGSCSRTRAAH